MSRILVAIVGVITLFGALIADFISAGAAQHLANPNWPPHAKFHDAQYIVMSMLLAVIALVLLWRKGSVLVPAAILATPWLGMFGALLFPGTSMLDPEFDEPSAYLLGLHPQIWIAGVLVAVLAIAVATDRRHVSV